MVLLCVPFPCIQALSRRQQDNHKLFLVLKVPWQHVVSDPSLPTQHNTALSTQSSPKPWPRSPSASWPTAVAWTRPSSSSGSLRRYVCHRGRVCARAWFVCGCSSCSASHPHHMSPTILRSRHTQGFDVICYCANVGQYKEDFDKVREKAMKCGASKVRQQWREGREGGGGWRESIFSQIKRTDVLRRWLSCIQSSISITIMVYRCTLRTSARSS